MKTFDQLGAYAFVHHRALNAPDKLAAAVERVAAHPQMTHAFEGDVCWNFSGAARQIYFRHPTFIFDTLSDASVKRGIEDGTLVSLADLDQIAASDVRLILELKVGRGDWRAAIATLVETLERRFSGRYWIDSFSPTLLRAVKAHNPAITTTLHTECVFAGRALVGAPEWWPVHIKRLSELTFADGIAVRWHGSNRYMERAAADVRASGKPLVMSCLTTPERFRASKAWGAVAGYAHSDFDTFLQLHSLT